MPCVIYTQGQRVRVGDALERRLGVDSEKVVRGAKDFYNNVVMMPQHYRCIVNGWTSHQQRRLQINIFTHSDVQTKRMQMIN